MPNNIIAVDGPAAAGKGTLSRNLAKHLNFAHMDTGALYRAVALNMIENSLDAIPAAQDFSENFAPDQLQNPDLRQDHVGQQASVAAAENEVRQILLDLQRNFAANPGEGYDGAVLDGRDIGTVICPDAPAKLFITAQTEIRAQRRTKELQSKGLPATYEAVLKDMRERDARDTSRNAAPMKPADDAFILDTGDLTEDQVFEKALKFVKSKLQI
jgi:cytidylate kinase